MTISSGWKPHWWLPTQIFSKGIKEIRNLKLKKRKGVKCLGIVEKHVVKSWKKINLVVLWDNSIVGDTLQQVHISNDSKFMWYSKLIYHSISSNWWLGDMVLQYLRNLRCLILGRYCSYLRPPQHLRIGNCSKKLWIIRVLTINDLCFAHFSDISLQHRKFWLVHPYWSIELSIRR